MLNRVILCGRIIEIDNNFKTITIKVPRNEKDDNGEYLNDIIDIKVISDNIFKSASEYCTIDTMIGVKGYLSRENTKDMVTIIADSITFLTSKQDKEINY